MIQERSTPAKPADPPELSPYSGLRTRGEGTPRTMAPPLFLLVMLGVAVPLLITLGLAMASELQVMAVALGILALLAIFVNPFWGLVAFVGLLYTRPEEVLPALAGMRLTLMVSVITLVAFTFHSIIKRQSPVKTPINYLMAGFALIVMISAIPTGILS
ncbi:MAG: hypothetical protein KY468_04335, partial [Armatimonadetes bacterium]|nr:hypothetical protein [Armatimonadota bacterium]